MRSRVDCLLQLFVHLFRIIVDPVNDFLRTASQFVSDPLVR